MAKPINRRLTVDFSMVRERASIHVSFAGPDMILYRYIVREAARNDRKLGAQVRAMARASLPPGYKEQPESA